MVDKLSEEAKDLQLATRALANGIVAIEVSLVGHGFSIDFTTEVPPGFELPPRDSDGSVSDDDWDSVMNLTLEKYDKLTDYTKLLGIELNMDFFDESYMLVYADGSKEPFVKYN